MNNTYYFVYPSIYLEYLQGLSVLRNRITIVDNLLFANSSELSLEELNSLSKKSPYLEDVFQH
jgi:hypothetical protein